METARRERFEELYRENYGAVRGYLLRRAEPELAQEALSETFLAAWRRLDRLPADALPWLLGTARKTLTNQRRTAGRLANLRERASGRRRPRAAIPPSERATPSCYTSRLRGSANAIARRSC